MLNIIKTYSGLGGAVLFILPPPSPPTSELYATVNKKINPLI